MRISSFLMPFFALASGAAGFYLRMVELQNVIDARTGLAQRGARETYILIAVCVLFLIISLMFSIRAAVKHQSLRGFDNAFGTDPLTYPFSFIVIGLAWLGATVMHFFDYYSAAIIPMTELYFSILSALSAISIAYFAIEMYQDPRRKMVYALSIVPSLFMCFWLIVLYRRNATNPVLISYVYQCLAVISSTLAFYFTSGFVYGKPAPGKTIFTYLASIFFCFVTLADGHSLAVRVIFAALIAVNVIYSSKLIRNMRRKVKP